MAHASPGMTLFSDSSVLSTNESANAWCGGEAACLEADTRKKKIKSKLAAKFGDNAPDRRGKRVRRCRRTHHEDKERIRVLLLRQIHLWFGRHSQFVVHHITHDPDDVQQTAYFHNRRVEPSNEYIYDALYRLIQADGREHLGQAAGGERLPPTAPDGVRWSRPCRAKRPGSRARPSPTGTA